MPKNLVGDYLIISHSFLLEYASLLTQQWLLDIGHCSFPYGFICLDSCFSDIHM